MFHASPNILLVPWRSWLSWVLKTYNTHPWCTSNCVTCIDRMFIDCLHLACFCKIMLKCPMVNYLWTNKYVYFYMYISICISLYIYIYVCILCLLSICTNVFTYVFMSMPTNGCIHTYPHMCICMCLPLYIYTYMCMWHYVWVHIRIHPYVYCIYIYIYIYIYIGHASCPSQSPWRRYHHRRQPAHDPPKAL